MNSRSPFIVAELSANHLGSLERAMRIVEAAAKAGADAIKLQTWKAGTMAGAHQLTEGPWAGRKLSDLYAEAFTPWEWHKPLFDRAKELGMEWFSSVFDHESLAFLETLNVPRYKIASFELVDVGLITKTARTGKPMILSCGMATEKEIHDSVLVAKQNGCTDLTVLKCTSAYPAKTADANLATMQDMRKFGKVGLSDHSPGILVAVAATVLGATVIEKHLTLSRKDGGPDAGFSMEPSEFSSLVTGCRMAADAVGTVQYGPRPSEAAQLGLRRSVWLVKDVKAGDRLSEHHVRTARPASGMEPAELANYIGFRFRKSASAGQPLKYEMLVAN